MQTNRIISGKEMPCPVLIPEPSRKVQPAFVPLKGKASASSVARKVQPVQQRAAKRGALRSCDASPLTLWLNRPENVPQNALVALRFEWLKVRREELKLAGTCFFDCACFFVINPKISC